MGKYFVKSIFCSGRVPREYTPYAKNAFSSSFPHDPLIYGQALSGDAEARRLAEYEEMSRRDNAARMKGAYKEGRQEGEQQGTIKVARNALREKMPMETIAKLTGLSLDEIKELAADLS